MWCWLVAGYAAVLRCCAGLGAGEHTTPPNSISRFKHITYDPHNNILRNHAPQYGVYCRFTRESWAHQHACTHNGIHNTHAHTCQHAQTKTLQLIYLANFKGNVTSMRIEQIINQEHLLKNIKQIFPNEDIFDFNIS